MKSSEYKYIVIKDGTAMLSGTTTKVTELVIEYYSYGWSPEEIKRQHPHLTLSQIYSALAYYNDNIDKIQSEISKSYEYAESLRNKFENKISKELLLNRIRYGGYG